MDSGASFQEILNRLMETAGAKEDTSPNSHPRSPQEHREWQNELPFEWWHRVAQKPIFPQVPSSKRYQVPKDKTEIPLPPELPMHVRTAILFFRDQGFPSVHNKTSAVLIKRCFRTLAKRLHPDFNPEKGEAPFRELQTHYQILLEYLEQAPRGS